MQKILLKTLLDVPVTSEPPANPPPSESLSPPKKKSERAKRVITKSVKLSELHKKEYSLKDFGIDDDQLVFNIWEKT